MSTEQMLIRTAVFGVPIEHIAYIPNTIHVDHVQFARHKYCLFIFFLFKFPTFNSCIHMHTRRSDVHGSNLAHKIHNVQCINGKSLIDLTKVLSLIVLYTLYKCNTLVNICMSFMVRSGFVVAYAHADVVSCANCVCLHQWECSFTVFVSSSSSIIIFIIIIICVLLCFARRIQLNQASSYFFGFVMSVLKFLPTKFIC